MNRINRFPPDACLPPSTHLQPPMSDYVRHALGKIERIRNRYPSALRPQGRLKCEPEDFVVDEIAAYEPCGSGDHLFLRIEKRDASDEELRSHLARQLGISGRSIGIAGKKDKRAVTRQNVSVPADAADRVSAIESDRFRVLSHSRHTNKLRTGHLKGNRFSIVVRLVESHAGIAASMDAVRQRVRSRGFANFFGDQRFGHRGQTAIRGLNHLLNDPTRSAPSRRHPTDLRLELSAIQSLLFNCVLAERVEDDTLRRFLPGDIAKFTRSNATFAVDEPDTEQSRLDAGEIVPTGPMFGPKMARPTAAVQERELRVLDEAGLNAEHFSRFRKLAPGTRRALVAFPSDLDVDVADDHVVLRFSLPAGVYATVLVSEFFEIVEPGKR